MKNLKAKLELNKINLQINELAKIYKASNLSDKKIQEMLSDSIRIKNHLKSIIF